MLDGPITDWGVERVHTRPGDRRALWATLERIYRWHAPAVVVVEQVMRHSGVYAAHVYGGQIAILEFLHDKPLERVSVQAVKRALGLKVGGTAKQTMAVECARRLGYNVGDHNEADAIGIALAYRGK